MQSIWADRAGGNLEEIQLLVNNLFENCMRDAFPGVPAWKKEPQERTVGKKKKRDHYDLITQYTLTC